MPSITHDSRIGKLAASWPGASRVFMRHNLDFCCSGNRTLGQACAERKLDVSSIIDEIEHESQSPSDDAASWDDASLSDLIDHIVKDYHKPLRTELPRLLEMATKVKRVHGKKDPDRLPRLLFVLGLLRDDLYAHMEKEERVLFPWIKSGRGELASRPVHVMLLEHEDAGELLDEIRELTDDFQPPRGACATWRGLWQGLAQLDEALRVHIHLENNILFPRALAGEAPG